MTLGNCASGSFVQLEVRIVEIHEALRLLALLDAIALALAFYVRVVWPRILGIYVTGVCVVIAMTGLLGMQEIPENLAYFGLVFLGVGLIVLYWVRVALLRRERSTNA